MNPPSEYWELVYARHERLFEDTVGRMKVPGGWIYRNRVRDGKAHMMTMVFVPEPQEGHSEPAD